MTGPTTNPELALTVLGSGGPFLAPSRMSAGYLISHGGAPRVIVDVGGGTFERLGRLGVELDGLETVCITHGHIDHTGGLAPLVFALVMGGRDRPLRVFGQAGRDGQPGIEEMCALLFGAAGAWRYLHSFDNFALEAQDLPSESGHAGSTTVLEAEGLTIRSVAVPHGMMPALAYRIDAPAASIVISGDSAGYHLPLVELARGADLLVHDMALPERATKHGHLHAKPSDVGRTAADAGVERLLLTHVMPELEDERDEAERIVRRHFHGQVEWAYDLMRIVL